MNKMLYMNSPSGYFVQDTFEEHGHILNSLKTATCQIDHHMTTWIIVLKILEVQEIWQAKAAKCTVNKHNKYNLEAWLGIWCQKNTALCANFTQKKHPNPPHPRLDSGGLIYSVELERKESVYIWLNTVTRSQRSLN